MNVIFGQFCDFHANWRFCCFHANWRFCNFINGFALKDLRIHSQWLIKNLNPFDNKKKIYRCAMPPTSNTGAVDYKLYIPQDAKVLRIHSLVSEYSLLRTWNTESGLKLTGIDTEKIISVLCCKGKHNQQNLAKKKKKKSHLFLGHSIHICLLSRNFFME